MSRFFSIVLRLLLSLALVMSFSLSLYPEAAAQGLVGQTVDSEPWPACCHHSDIRLKDSERPGRAPLVQDYGIPRHKNLSSLGYRTHGLLDVKSLLTLVATLFTTMLAYRQTRSIELEIFTEARAGHCVAIIKKRSRGKILGWWILASAIPVLVLLCAGW